MSRSFSGGDHLIHLPGDGQRLVSDLEVRRAAFDLGAVRFAGFLLGAAVYVNDMLPDGIHWSDRTTIPPLERAREAWARAGWIHMHAAGRTLR